MENTIKIQDVDFEKTFKFENGISFYFQKDLIPHNYKDFIVKEIKEIHDETEDFLGEMSNGDILRQFEDDDEFYANYNEDEYRINYPLVIVQNNEIIKKLNLNFSPIEYATFYKALEDEANSDKTFKYFSNYINTEELNEFIDDFNSDSFRNYEIGYHINIVVKQNSLLLQFYVFGEDKDTMNNFCLTIKDSVVNVSQEFAERPAILTYLEVNDGVEFFVFERGYNLKPFNNSNDFGVINALEKYNYIVTPHIEDNSNNFSFNQDWEILQLVYDDEYPDAHGQTVIELKSIKTLPNNHFLLTCNLYEFNDEDCFYGCSNLKETDLKIFCFNEDIISLPNSYSIREIKENYLTMETKKNGSKIPTLIYLFANQTIKYFDSVAKLDEFIKQLNLGIDTSFNNSVVQTEIKVNEEIKQEDFLFSLDVRKKKIVKKRIKFEENDF
jgi:hypothetical protein